MQEDEEKNLSDLSKRFLLVISEQYLNLSGYKLRNAGIISSQSTLTSIKKGIQQPSRKTIDLLCEKYGVDKAWLYTGVRQDTSEVSPVFSESEESEPFTVNHNGVKFYEASNGYRMVVKRVPFCAYGRFINECNTLEPSTRINANLLITKRLAFLFYSCCTTIAQLGSRIWKILIVLLYFFKYKIDIKSYFSYYEYLTFYHLYIIAVDCFKGVGIY